MPLYRWNYKDHFKKLPARKFIIRYGRRKWDVGIEYKEPATTAPESKKKVFTMPTFGRHGRWGNIVFQYIFIRVLALNNNRDLQLNRSREYLNNRINLYEDIAAIPALEVKPTTIILDGYHIFPYPLNNIPPYMWRAMFVSEVRRQKCYVIEDVDEAINTASFINNAEDIEVEGLFMVNPLLYKQKKEFIVNQLFKPVPAFKHFIDACMSQLGEDKTIIGIHIRRGDFIYNPLDQMFQIPVPVKYINEWLSTNILSYQNPVIYVCSDDENAFKEIEKAGFKVVSTNELKLQAEASIDYEQLEWEILRRCDVILTSNSSFSFSAAFLSLKNPDCYQFSLSNKAFVPFDPWACEPLQFFTFLPSLTGYLSARFSLISQMVNKKSAVKRVVKDLQDWLFWKRVKLSSLHYIIGFSPKYFVKLLNLRELFTVYNRQANPGKYKQLDKIKV